MTTPEERLVEDLLARGINLSKLVGAIRRTLAHKRDGGSDSTDGGAPSLPPSVADPTIAEPAPDGPQPIPGLSRYLDLGRLGMGGMGEVRRVFDRTLQRTLALKMIHGPALNRPQLVARFLEEAKATAQLEHPGIIPVHDLGRLPDGRLWFSMKEVSGQDLSKIIANLHQPASADQAEQWTLRRVIEVLRRVCETMAYAHGRGVLHRDLKPSNIMVGAHGEVIVIDWGIAKLLHATASSIPLQSSDPDLPRQTGEQEPLTQEGHVPGTPAYMSPEHALGSSELDARSDVYALGAILYKILSGRSPYRGSALSILEQVVEGPPQPIAPFESLTATLVRQIDDEADFAPRPVLARLSLPPALIATCERAMARDPSARFSDAQQMARALEEWLDGTQRRRDALEVVESATERLAEANGLRVKADRLQAEAHRQLMAIEAWRPLADKVPAWTMLDEARNLEATIERTELGAERLLYAALRVAPDLPEAHEQLAWLARAAHAAAEENRRDVTRHALQLRRHVAALPDTHPDRPTHVRYLTGDGALTLVTEPPGATVQIYRYVEQERRLVLERFAEAGRTPICRFQLPMGRYLCRIEHPDRADVRYPVFIERGHHWDGIPPDGTDPTPVLLPEVDALGPDDCYIPAGWFWFGGDPRGRFDVPRCRLWLGPRVMRRYPVSWAQMLAFLNDLVARGRTNEALRYAPALTPTGPNARGRLLVGFDGQQFSLRPDLDGDTKAPDWPVDMVDWSSARAYARWERARTGQDWRLPTEFEWEKAARGVDARLYPFGDHFDPAMARMQTSTPDRPTPSNGCDFPVDQSPYGVRGMAGNSTDWCHNRFEAHLRLSTDTHAPAAHAEESDVNAMAFRGGSWFSSADRMRSADRAGEGGGYRNGGFGFRLLRTLSLPEGVG